MTTKEIKQVTMARLTTPVYNALVKQCPPIMVQRDTTELQVAYSLGVQHVLQLLREGYVIEQ